MAGESEGTRYYWQRHTDGSGSWTTPQGGPPGHVLAAFRRGLGREAGDVPTMWEFYTTLRHDGQRSRMLRAEHLTLTLFAVHQQSKRLPVHRTRIGLGTAMLALRGSGKFSADAVDRRFAAAATATSFREVGAHLRGLVTQLRSMEPGGLDYTQLLWDLYRLQSPDEVASVRLKWGSQYFVRDNQNAGTDSTKDARETASSPTADSE